MDQRFVKVPGKPHSIDIHVGARVRQRRKALGISQGALAESVEITFQQIQKYERGANRISASKLHQISLALEMPIAYFFEGLPFDSVEEISAEENTADTFLRTSEGQALAAHFTRLSPPQRKGVMSLVRALLNDGD